MRTMFDAVNPANIPAGGQLVAGYIDAGPNPAGPPWTDEDFARFPGLIPVRIATQWTTDAGIVLDVENGDATPEQAPGWVAMRRRAGADPSVYVSEAAWPVVKQAFAHAGVQEPYWWVAGYPGSVGEGNLYPGSVAHQYGGNPDGGYDVSVVADYWPGVDPQPVPPQPTPGGEPVMLTLTINGVEYLFWNDQGILWYRSIRAGVLETAIVLTNAASTGNLLLIGQVTAYGPVVYGAAKETGKTVRVTQVPGQWGLHAEVL